LYYYGNIKKNVLKRYAVEKNIFNLNIIKKVISLKLGSVLISRGLFK
jgi:hypothetical protein